MSEVVAFPGQKSESQRDPILEDLVIRMEAYVEGQLISDQHKREIIAAYLSGMVSALDMVSPKKKQKYLVLPLVLQQKIINFATKLGMQFEKK